MEQTIKIQKDEKRRRQILGGNLWKVVVAITLPLFLYQLINSFYTLVDQILVANIGDNEVSAVATIAQIKSLISALGLGLAGGGTIIVSRLYGAGNIKEAKKNANVMFTMSLIICGVILLLMPFSNLILELSQVPDELIAISETYFRLQLFEQILMVINSLFIAIEKSKGNTKIIFICNFIVMILKISLDALFIYGFKVTSLVYIEIASIVAQGAMFVIGLVRLFSKKNIFQINFKEFSLSWKYVKKIIVMSFPLFLGKFVISFGKVSVNAMCKVYGPLTVGALGISNNISGVITNPGASFEDSESAIVSQNLGNKNIKRSLKTFGISCLYMGAWTLIGFLCVRVFFEDQIINLFSTENTHPEFVEMIKNIFFYDCLSIPALAINSVILGLLYGYGQTVLATVNNLVRIATRIITLWILQTYFPEIGAEAAGISMGISNIAIAILAIVVFLIFFINLKRKGYKGMRINDPEPIMEEKDGILVRKEISNKQIIKLSDFNKDLNGELETNITNKNNPVVLIIPGGGYEHLSTRESIPVAVKFFDLGYNTAILRYSVKPYHNPTQFDELKESIKYLKKECNQLIVIGFSAGGHLAGLGITSELSKEINAAILCYPVISFEQFTHEETRSNFFGGVKEPSVYKEYSINERVTKDTTPTFIWTTKDDECVPYQNTLMMTEALKKNNVKCKSKIYPHGPHGIALADKTAIVGKSIDYLNKDIAKWPLIADKFIKKILYEERKNNRG